MEYISSKCSYLGESQGQRVQALGGTLAVFGWMSGTADMHMSIMSLKQGPSVLKPLPPGVNYL